METQNKQSIKTYRFSDNDFNDNTPKEPKFTPSEFEEPPKNFNVPFPETLPIKKSIYDYLGWVYDTFPYLINRKLIHLSHFQRKAHCDRDEFYSIFRCTKCKELHWSKIPCCSFFCEKCHNHLVKRYQNSLATYMWNVRHRYLVFTTPPEVRDKLTWITMPWFYRVVRETISEFFNQYYKKPITPNPINGKSRKIQVGVIANLHTYGSKDLEWKPHMNVMITCRGIKQKRVDGKIKRFTVSTSYINYDRLREIYKRKLEYYFQVIIKDTPQIKVDDKKYQDRQDIRNGKIGIPPENAVGSLQQYFKKVPIKDENLLKIDEAGNITWTTYKRIKKRLKPVTTQPTQFYNLVMQHIPRKNFRNIRLWCCYQYNHKLRKFIPALDMSEAKRKAKLTEQGIKHGLSEAEAEAEAEGIIKEEKELICLKCKAPLELIGVVARGEVFKDLFPIFNSSDFSPQPNHPDLRGGRPPDEWEPPKRLLFSICGKISPKKRAEPQPSPIIQPADNGIIVTEGIDFEISIKGSKESHLEVLYYEVGTQATNFRVCSTYMKEGEIFFSKRYNYFDIVGTMFLDKCNQREQLHNEIVLDQDKGDYQALIKKLKENDVRFYAYATKQNRAQHIHCYFKRLAELSKFDRETMREKFIKKYDCDTALKSDSHLIAMEFCEHWKTKDIKNLIDCNPGINSILLQPIATSQQNKEFENYLQIIEMV